MVPEDSIWCCIWPSYCAPPPAETQYLNDCMKLTLLIVAGCSVFCFFRQNYTKADRMATARENAAIAATPGYEATDSMGKLKSMLKRVASQTNRVCAESGAEIGGKAMGSLRAVRNAIVEFVREADYEQQLQRGEPTAAAAAAAAATAAAAAVVVGVAAATVPGRPHVEGNKTTPPAPPPPDLAVKRVHSTLS